MAPRALANRRLQPLGHPSTDEWVHGVCGNEPSVSSRWGQSASAAAARRVCRQRSSTPLGASRGDETASSVCLSGRGEIEILQRHLLEKPLVFLLRQRPQDRVGLLAGVPVFAAANPDGPGKGGAEAGEEFLGRGYGRGGRGAAGAPLGNEPHDAADLLVEAQR